MSDSEMTKLAIYKAFKQYRETIEELAERMKESVVTTSEAKAAKEGIIKGIGSCIAMAKSSEDYWGGLSEQTTR